jgi:hypothetical protein
MICDQTGYSLGSALTLVNDRSWNGPRLVSNAELTTKVPVNALGILSEGEFFGVAGLDSRYAWGLQPPWRTANFCKLIRRQ